MKTQLLHIKQYLLLFGLFLGLAFMVSCSDDEDDDKKDDASAKPVFLKPKGYSATITENAAVTDNLKTVKATLEGGEITYQFGDAKTANPLVKLYLAIDAKTGKISTKKVVDYEDPLLGEIKKVAGFKANSNILIPVPVEAVQKDKPENKSSVILTITIVNVDEAPTFDDPGTRTITLAAAEASTATALAPAGDPVIATDPDAGAMAVTYALYKTGTTASAEFQINSTSGQISATPDAAFTSPSYPVSVKATSGSKSATQPVTITVTGAASSVTFEDPPESGVEFDVATDTQIANYKVVKTTGAIAVDDVLVTVSAGTGFTYTFSTAGGATATYTGYSIAAGVITATAAIADVVGTANDREFFVKATKTADANVYKVARVALTLGAVDPITTFAPAVPAESYSVLAPVTGTVTMTSIDTYTVTRAAADVDMAGDHVLTVEAGPSVTIYSLVSTFAGAANAGTDVTGKVKIDPLSGVVTTKAAITGTLTFYVKAVNGLTAGATFQRVAKVDLTVGAAALAFEAVDLEPNVTFVAVAGANAASYALTKTVESLNAASYAILTVALAGSATTTYSLVTDATGTAVSTGTKLAIASSGVVSTTSTRIAVADSPLTFYVKAMRGSSAVVAKVVLTVGKEIPFAVSAANFTQGVLSSIDFVTVFATGVLTITLPDGFSDGTIGTVLARTSPAVTGAMTSFASDGTVNTNGVLSLPVATNITYTAGVLSIVSGRKTQAIAAATSIASANNFYFEIPAATGYVNRVIRLVLVAAATPSTFMPALGDFTPSPTHLGRVSFLGDVYTVNIPLASVTAVSTVIGTLDIASVSSEGYAFTTTNTHFSISGAGEISRTAVDQMFAAGTDVPLEITITKAAYTSKSVTVNLIPKGPLAPPLADTHFTKKGDLEKGSTGDATLMAPINFKLTLARAKARVLSVDAVVANLTNLPMPATVAYYANLADFRTETVTLTSAVKIALATSGSTRDLTLGGYYVAAKIGAIAIGDIEQYLLVTSADTEQLIKVTVSVSADPVAPVFVAPDPVLTGVSFKAATGTDAADIAQYEVVKTMADFRMDDFSLLTVKAGTGAYTYSLMTDHTPTSSVVTPAYLALDGTTGVISTTTTDITLPYTASIYVRASNGTSSEDVVAKIVLLVDRVPESGNFASYASGIAAAGGFNLANKLVSLVLTKADFADGAAAPILTISVPNSSSTAADFLTTDGSIGEFSSSTSHSVNFAFSSTVGQFALRTAKSESDLTESTYVISVLIPGADGYADLIWEIHIAIN